MALANATLTHFFHSYIVKSHIIHKSFSHVYGVFKLINQISQRGDMKHQVGKAMAFKTIGLFPSSDVGDAFQA